MELKDYQGKVIERIGRYLDTLRDKREEAEEYAEFQRSKGRESEPRDFCADAWDQLRADGLLPVVRNQQGEPVATAYVDRRDGLNRPIPTVCLKVPTAGGKTLLATGAIERITTDYLRKQTGLVLWVVPSDAIYRQTWKALANREHSYRQVLERTSGGRVKLLEKGDPFTRKDIEEHLCVMVLMLQSSARQTKEQLRMFRDTGKFTSFYPDVDDFTANEELLQAIPNLEINSPAGGGADVLRGVSVKQSLGNTLRLIRPVIVIDEGHRAYSNIARETLASFNPQFILELSATPNAREWLSNILVDVPGTALKDEQMIKLPINIGNFANADWKHTLTQSNEELARLGRHAAKLEHRDGRYIRPIMLIRADRTGNDQRDGVHVHAEDVREYLIDHLGVRPEAIRVKSAATDELGDEDLSSPFSKVRYIITKDALREGWDCPFAYVLTLLSKTTATTAMTQMVGRVLRQPGTRETSIPELNQCYIFCFDQEVWQAVDSVRKGLEEEGMGDLSRDVKMLGTGEGDPLTRNVSINRRERFQNTKILLPRVLHKDGGRSFRALDYERDILAALDWSVFGYTERSVFTPDDRDRMHAVFAQVNMKDHDGRLTLPYSQRDAEADRSIEFDFAFMTRQLVDVIPNPWHAARILEETLDALRERGINEQRIAANRLFLLDAMTHDLRRQVDQAAETLFRNKLEIGAIVFRLVGSSDPELNWQLAETINLAITDGDRVLTKQDGSPVERSIFERVYAREFNPLERDVALYLDDTEAVRWWHRLVAKQDYHLQGWQRNKVYPDFLACITSNDSGFTFHILETKGAHLIGNDDTRYKEQLFDLLGKIGEHALEAGEVELKSGASQKMTFKILLNPTWRTELATIA
jgi:type III restriction enzyme